MQFLKHIQFQQLLNLMLLILLAYFNGTLQTSPLFVLTLVLFAMGFELLLKQKLYVPYSAAITALGVVLMVGWLQWQIPFVIIALALLQKYFVKLDSKHIFNPSNFALLAAIVLFYPKALPIIGEVGKESIILYIIIIIGVSILIRVNRIVISLSFLGSYIALSFFFIGKSNPMWNFDHFLDSFYSSSFIVYIFFMLTDPITTPKSLMKQAMFGALVAFVSVALNYFIGVRLWHMFIALFIVSIAAVPLYRSLSYKEIRPYLILLSVSFLIVAIISTKKSLYFSM